MPSPQAVLATFQFRDTSIKYKDMEMLTFLSHKLRAQSLHEGQPFHPPELDQECVYERDSGTESDEENAELEALERHQGSFDDVEDAGRPNLQAASPPLPFISTTSSTTPFYVPPRSVLSPVNSITRKRPPQLVKQRTARGAFHTVDSQPFHQPPPSPPQTSSDFERCSLDYEPASSIEFDRNSSEEELAHINCSKSELPSEKRKWSQMSRCGSCTDSLGSSDDEVRDLLACSRHEERCPQPPLVFSSSPPRGVQHLRTRLTTPTVFLARLSPGPIQTVCSKSSPRKRHRQSGSRDVSDATVIPRPCLDFDKMQVSAPHLVFLH